MTIDREMLRRLHRRPINGWECAGCGEIQYPCLTIMLLDELEAAERTICAECSEPVVPTDTALKCACGAISIGEMVWRRVSLLQLKGVLLVHAEELQAAEATAERRRALLCEILAFIEPLPLQSESALTLRNRIAVELADKVVEHEHRWCVPTDALLFEPGALLDIEKAHGFCRYPGCAIRPTEAK